MRAALTNTRVTCNLEVWSQGNVLRAAALAGDTAAAGALCALVRDNPPGTNSSLDPDWRGAAYIAAVVQPPGCNLKDEGVGRPAWSCFL